MRQKLLFHCHFGGTHGWGHLIRSSALAAEAKARGFHCILWTDGDSRNLIDDIKNAFHTITPELPNETFFAVIFDDHYITAEQIEAIPIIGRPHIVVVDDEGKRDLSFASLVVNPSLDAEKFSYPDVRSKCVGPEFALLRTSFRGSNNLRLKRMEDQAELERRTNLAIMMGGTDILNLQPEVLRMSLRYFGSRLNPVLIGPEKPETREAIREIIAQYPRVQWFQHASGEVVAQILHQCRYAISACGGAVYELAACNVPFLGVVVAENQKYFGEAVQQYWGLPVIQANDLNETTFRDAFVIIEQTRPNFSGVDGQGAKRVINTLRQLC